MSEPPDRTRSDHRDWIRRTLRHEDGPVAYNFSFSPPAKASLTAHFAADDLKAALGLPIRTTSLGSVKPLYASPEQFGPTVTDEFGVVWSTNEIDRGSPIGAPLAEATLAGFPWPDARSEHRFAPLGAWVEANREHFCIVWIGEMWERATFLRGMEGILLDVALHPTFVEELLECLTEHLLTSMAALFERFAFDAVALSDDYGTQRGMLISPESWRAMIRPRLARLIDFAHDHGRAFFLHSCGNIRPILGDLADLGLDILHPLQPEAMDVLAVKREFGRDLTLCGGLRTQDLLPHGSPEDVRAEVGRLKRELGAGGGYILEPGITVQADVPLANMLAMIDEARRA